METPRAAPLSDAAPSEEATEASFGYTITPRSRYLLGATPKSPRSAFLLDARGKLRRCYEPDVQLSNGANQAPGDPRAVPNLSFAPDYIEPQRLPPPGHVASPAPDMSEPLLPRGGPETENADDNSHSEISAPLLRRGGPEPEEADEQVDIAQQNEGHQSVLNA